MTYKPGDKLKAADVQRLLEALDGAQQSDVGYVDGQARLTGSRPQNKHVLLKAKCDDEVPPFSVLGLRYLDEPNVFGVEQVGNSAALFTNDSLALPANKFGLVRPLNLFGSARVRCVEDKKPAVGQWCGPEHEEWGVSKERTGLLCIGDAANLSDDTETVVVVRANDSLHLLAEVTEEIDGFDIDEYDNKVLGKGKVKIQFRDKDGMLISVASPYEDEEDWEVEVWNTTRAVYPEESLIHICGVLGIGLTVVGPANQFYWAQSMEDLRYDTKMASMRLHKQLDDGTLEAMNSFVDVYYPRLPPGRYYPSSSWFIVQVNVTSGLWNTIGAADCTELDLEEES